MRISRKCLSFFVFLSVVSSLSLCLNALVFAQDVFIDNRSSNTSRTGIWEVSGATSFYGSDSVWARGGDDTFTWRFTPSQTGEYEVWEWHTSYYSRTTAAPHRISHAGGTTTINVNQQLNGGKWNSLGVFSFQAGVSYAVALTSVVSSTASTCADAVRFTFITSDPAVTITSPADFFLQTSPDLTVRADALNLETGQGVKFVLDAGTADERSLSDYASPFTQVFTGLSLTEHTVDVYVVDNSGNVVSGADTHDQVIQIGIGDYYVGFGNSITVGYGDDDPSDNLSADGRNIGNGYEPGLNDRLTDALGIPHFVKNAGVGGDDSSDGLARVSSVLSANPDAQIVLIQFGTNDATLSSPTPSGKGLNPGDPGYAGSFKANLQGIINAVINSGKEPCLDKPPIVRGSGGVLYSNPDDQPENLRLKEYHQVIDELVNDPLNDILVAPPDFYAYFKAEDPATGRFRYIDQYFDDIHPNGLGYRSMASVWADYLTHTKAVIRSITPNPAAVGTQVTFVGYGRNPNGSVVGYRWQSDRDGTLSTSASFTTSSLTEGDHTISFRVQGNDGSWSDPVTESLSIGDVPIPIESIVDNRSPNTSKTGSWEVSGATNFYGADSVWARGGDDTFTWHFTPSQTGQYEVWEWHTAYSSRTTAAPHRISHAGGTTTINVNQQLNGGKWNRLGVFSFQAGVSYAVALTSVVSSTASTCADAVKWSSAQTTNTIPVATIDSITPNPAAAGQSVAFEGHGSDADGSVTAYRWSSNLGGVLSTSAWFDASNLAVGTHTISFEVQDDDEAWSDPVTQSLTINSASADIVIDNGSSSTSSTGTWEVSGATGSYSTSSVWARGGDDTFTWRFTPPQTGTYEVWEWHTVWPSRTTQAPYRIAYAGGTQTVYVNQQINGGRWNSLGVFTFQGGVTYTVTLTSVVSSTASTCADAIRVTTSSSTPPSTSGEQIYACLGYGSGVNPRGDMLNFLTSMGASQDGTVWKYTSSQGKEFTIHIVEDLEGMKQALKTEGAHVLFKGHSNYGLGSAFGTYEERLNNVIEDIYYIDDPRILKISSPMINVSVRGVRTGQAFPNWWPIYQDGTSGIMPYDFDDPAGNPPYNYYISYQLPGDPTHYRMEPVNYGALPRFPDSGTPPWYASDGSTPNPFNPDHLQYFMTNSEPWSPSLNVSGDWYASNEIEGFFRDDYLYLPAGAGQNEVEWLFTIEEPGDYMIHGWWPASSSNTAGARYVVNHATGSTARVVDQRVNGGQWNELGQYHFEAGDYSVVLTDQASSGRVVADGVRITAMDNPPAVIQADFNAETRYGPAPLEVTFDSESTGDITSFEWDLGDGYTNGTRTQLTHIYTNPGTYTVKFTVNGPAGTSTRIRTGYIIVGNNVVPPLRAEFSGNGQTGIVPLESSCADLSSGAIVSWSWDFDNDGVVDSNDRNPSHTYTEPGNYTVSLTVRDAYGNIHTETKPNFVISRLLDKSIDNVDYPKAHYREKTVILRKAPDVRKDELKYSRLFYEACNSGNYYLDTFGHGKVFYTVNTSSGLGFYTYLSNYLQGRSDQAIWEAIQSREPIYDYYDFNKLPSQQ